MSDEMRTERSKKTMTITVENSAQDAYEMLEASDQIGVLLQRICKTPADANCATMLFLGRLVAREGRPEYDVEQAWKETVVDQKSIFDAGFDIERNYPERGK